MYCGLDCRALVNVQLRTCTLLHWYFLSPRPIDKLKKPQTQGLTISCTVQEQESVYWRRESSRLGTIVLIFDESLNFSLVNHVITSLTLRLGK